MAFVSPAYAENLTQKSYTSGSYTQATNSSGNTIDLIGGGTGTDDLGAHFTSKFENQKDATITTINGWANFQGNFENRGKVGTIGGDAGFNGLNNYGGKIDSIGGNVVIGALKNGEKNANAANAYIGEISGGIIGDFTYYSGGRKTSDCNSPGNCVQNTGIIKKISGGTFTELANVKGSGMDWTTSEKYSYSGKVDEITGGTFAQVGNEGTINKISGGKFKDTVVESSGGGSGGSSGWDPDTDFGDLGDLYGGLGVGSGMWVDPSVSESSDIPAIKNYGTIGEITGTADIESMIVGSGYTNIAADFSAMSANMGAGRVEKISGGTIAKLDIQSETETSYWSDEETLVAGKEASIGTISGGKITTLNNGTERDNGGGIIDSIEGAANITTLTNRTNSTIKSISGGSIETLENSGTITDISGGKISTLNANKGSATISGGEISTLNYYDGTLAIKGVGAKVGTLDNKKADKTATLENSGEIGTLKGSFATLTNKGKINNISNGEVTNFTNSGVVSLSEKLVSKNFTNEASGTLIFNLSNSAAGQLVGDLDNKGAVSVDLSSGLALNQSYTIITGASTGLSAENIQINNPNSSFLDVSYDSGKISLQKSAAFSELKTQLGQNKGDLAEKFLTSKVGITSTSALDDTESTIKQSYISNPQQIISNFKANSVSNTPLGQGLGVKFTPTASEYKPTASADLLRFDNGYVVNSLVSEPQFEFFANPFYGELRGGDVKGSLGGISLGLGYLSEGYALQGHFTYAYADSSQDLATQSTDTTAYMFQVGLLGQLYFADLVEIDINANYLLGKFKLGNVVFADSSLNSSSKFNNHQGNVGVAAGLRFGSEFSIKPFVGLQNYFESQGKYSVLGFESEKYSDYALNGVAGVEGRAKIGDTSFLYARVSGEFNLVENQKELFMVNKEMNAQLKYANETYKNSVSAGLGAQIYATSSVKFSIEGLYKHHDSGLNYYGGSLGVRVGF